MQDETGSLTRRNLIAAGALGAVALAGLAGEAGAAEIGDMTEPEKKNIKLVEEFCKAFGDETPSPDKIAGYMTADAVWKIGPRPAAKGHAAILEQLNFVFKGGFRYDLKISDSFARGSMVVHTRVDTRSTAGGPPQPAPGPIAGAFIIKDGKIAEWYELFFPAK